MTKQLKAKIVAAYAEMSAHTQLVCSHKCKLSASEHRCCSNEYCEMADEIAKEDWGTTLERAGGKDSSLPFLRQDGSCSVPPHMRPLCTVHDCSICSIGARPDDLAWTTKYFKIRDRINKLEFSRLRGERKT